MSKAEAAGIREGLERYEYECLVEQARQMIGEPDEDTLENWEPLTMADLEGKEYTEPFYTDLYTREREARKAARKKQQEAAE